MRRLLASLSVAALLGACGTQAAGPGIHTATLVLDFTPNAIHAGIYEAIARGYDRAAGVRLRVIVPSASTDAIRLLLERRTEFAILDIHDLAIARERGEDIVGVMALVQRPLAAVIAQPGITTPRMLTKGGLVGVTGAPSDLAVLRSIVSGAGGDAARLKTITIGFNAVADLLAGRVAAATAFWNDEGVTLAHQRSGFHVFRAEAYGAPSYPELVLCTTGSQLRRHPSLTAAVVRAIRRGYDAVLRDPHSGVHALVSLVPGLSPTLVAEQLRAELPAFLPPGGGPYGLLDGQVLRDWARWEARFGVVSRVPDVRAMFDEAISSGRSP
jgi:ABC-type nitrate/sulfonate/bicarbonate transport system substrate-binding protein